MSYSFNSLPKHIHSAGKITVITALLGVMVFVVAFLLNIGAKELAQVDAQGVATTTVTVLNTPPQWTVDAQEETESSTTTPTNSGDEIAWVATATDSNSEDYYLLICSTADAPSSTAGGAPTCNGGPQWAVSSAASSGVQARAATTTTEAFAESNDWYAWICDSINPGARCNASSRQGTATTASPFNVNHRPSFTAFSDNSELIGALPGDVVTFYATSTDTDVVDTADTMRLLVCSTASYSTTTNQCGARSLATSTYTASTPLTATYTISIPTRDTTYGAFGFIIDEHGHEASGGEQGNDTVLTVANAAPSILGSDIDLNGGTNLTLTVEADETTNFTLDFEATDSNSCENISSGDEIVDYDVVIYRSGISTSTCDTTGANYDPNNCYDNAVATTTWNLDCTASSTSCTYSSDQIDTSMIFECTFPLWYIADPTSGGATNTVHFAQDWRASVRPIDDNSATGTLVETDFPVELNSFLSFALDTAAIPYGPLEPGQYTDPLTATTSLRATGNTGLDEQLTGEHMCDYYTSSVTCLPSATSTIADQFQTFATTSYSFAYASNTLGNVLSSSSQSELEINILKSTATNTQASGTTYWGIMVPTTITKAGTYTGENTIWGVVGEPTEW